MKKEYKVVLHVKDIKNFNIKFSELLFLLNQATSSAEVVRLVESKKVIFNNQQILNAFFMINLQKENCLKLINKKIEIIVSTDETYFSDNDEIYKFKDVKDIELTRFSYDFDELNEIQNKYSISNESNCMWVTKDKFSSYKYSENFINGIPYNSNLSAKELGIIEIPSSHGYIVEELVDDDHYLMVLKENN